MTLKKAVVKIGVSASKPGVAFVALSRVGHPDDLMLDDDFPALLEILKQSRHIWTDRANSADAAAKF